MALDAERYRLSEADHQDIFERLIKPQVFAGVSSQDKPVAVIFGGQPGAGKSAAVDAALRELEHHGRAAQIIGDDMRGYHPHFARLMANDDKTAAFYTDRDTGRWVEKAIAYAMQEKVNVIVEGTMRDGTKVAQTMSDLRGAGYEIDARALAVNERLSWQGVLQRYEAQKADRGQGRMTAPHSHRDAYEGMLLTIERVEREKLADRVTVYRRGGEVLYRNDLRDGDWVRPPAARVAVEGERARPMTLQERREYAAGFDALAEQMAKPGRNAAQAETDVVAALRLQARRELAAEAFRRLEPADALQEHRELAGAYGVLAAVAKRADADGLAPGQRDAVLDRARQNIAASIERGEAPSVQIRTEIEQRRGRDAER